MDTKRSQSLRKVATPQPSKTRTPPKTQSQASMTPSQASEAARLANGERNPLDALSRTSGRQDGSERRSGLQDIDEEYLKRMTMPQTPKPHPEHAAGKRTPQSNLQTDTNLGRNFGGAEAAQQQQQQMNTTQEQMMAQAQLQQGAVPNQQMSYPNAGQNMQAEMQQQQISQQVNYMPAAGEPELCTTCPNCQTTIYLARVPDGTPIPVAAGMHGQPEGPGMAAAKQ